MVEGTIVKFTVPVVFQDVARVELVSEAEDAVGTGLGGVEVVFEAFEWSEVFSGEVSWEAFDREAGKVVGHLMGFWRSNWRVLICIGVVAD